MRKETRERDEAARGRRGRRKNAGVEGGETREMSKAGKANRWGESQRDKREVQRGVRVQTGQSPEERSYENYN